MEQRRTGEVVQGESKSIRLDALNKTVFQEVLGKLMMIVLQNTLSPVPHRNMHKETIPKKAFSLECKETYKEPVASSLLQQGSKLFFKGIK